MSGSESKAEVDMDHLIGMALRYGVMISVALLIIGIALLARGGAGEVLGANSPLNTSVVRFPAVLSGIPSLNPLSFIALGLVVLIATPVLRVVLGIISFARERDALYVFITSIVLMNIMLAIFLVPRIAHA